TLQGGAGRPAAGLAPHSSISHPATLFPTILSKGREPMSKPSCPLQAQRCGGCPQLSVPYAGQLAAKQRRAEALFASLAPVAPILGAADPWHYRNKAIASFAEQRGRLTAGIYAAGTHRVLPLPESGCLLQAPILDRTIAAVVQTARA